MQRQNQWIAIIAIVLLLLTSVFSYEFLVNHANHACVGEDCPICLEMTMLAHNLTNLVIVSVISLAAAFLAVLSFPCLVADSLVSVKETPVTLRVRLLN